jgi:uncharacterized Zn finger protein (UPF0148 family)
MPCYRCGARQVDPARGPSPWKRGVQENCQVLICPQCQSGRDWASDLDRCPGCGSVRLVRRLGEVECRDCGQVRESAGTPTADATAAAGARAPASRAAGEGTAGTAAEDPAAIGDSAATEDSAAALAGEVARALDRVLGSHRVSR